MIADHTITPGERTVSGALALMMHLLFLALLVFGVSWQKREPVALVAELWSSLPPLPAPVAESPPKVAPAPPKPAPKVKPEPKPQPKADIDLREKKEKERKAKERALAEKKKREEQAVAENKKREEQARLEALKKQQAQEAEAKRAAQEQADALKKLAQQQAAAQAKIIDEYKRRIEEKIRRNLNEPPNLPKTAQVEFDVVLLPGGEVLGVKLRKSSALSAYDSAVERAILKAQPLPLPPDPALFREFRELNLRFRPKE